MSKREQFRCSKCGIIHPPHTIEFAILRAYLQSALNLIGTGRTDRIDRIMSDAIEEWKRLNAPFYADLTLLFPEGDVY